MYVGRAAINLKSQVLIEQLMGCRCPEELDEGSRYTLPPRGTEFLHVALEQLLQTRRSYSRKGIVLYKGRERTI